MSRPCTCNRCKTEPRSPYTLDQCRLCWLYTHEAGYRRLWDGVPPAQIPQARTDGCCGDGQGNQDNQEPLRLHD